MSRRRDEVARVARANPAPRLAREDVDEPGERILETILATPPDAADGGRTRRPRPLVKAAVVATAVVLVAGAGVAAARLSLFDFAEFPRPADVANEPRRIGPKEIVTAGQEGDLGWRLVAYRSTRGLCIGVEVAGAARAASAGCGVPDPRSRLSLPTADYIGGGVDRTWLYGRVTRRATRVTLVLADGRSVDAAVVQAPHSLNLPFAFYVVTVGGAAAGEPGDAAPIARADAYRSDDLIATARPPR